MSHPIIGITANQATRDGRALATLGMSYIHAIAMAGGAPLIIPPLADEDSLRTIIERLDGVLLSGGGDIAPERYGEQALPECGTIEPERDAMELALARRAAHEDLPLLGICRGIQLLNVALGGSLIQDIATQRAAADRHDWHAGHSRETRAHAISVAAGSRLAAILRETEHPVNSLHHQAVARVGDGLRVTAQAPDGIIEALEIANHPFALAVQFHPEELLESDPASRRLFAEFVRACAEGAAERAAQRARR